MLVMVKTFIHVIYKKLYPLSLIQFNLNPTNVWKFYVTIYNISESPIEREVLEWQGSFGGTSNGTSIREERGREKMKTKTPNSLRNNQ